MHIDTNLLFAFFVIMIQKPLRLLPLKASLAGLILSAILLLQASVASAATLSEDMVQASKDACVNLARRRGFTVENVIQAQPASGDSASVVLKLRKAGAPYEFKCGFSQSIDHFVEPAPALTTDRAAEKTTLTTPQAAPKAEASQGVRRERAVVVERNRDRRGDANAWGDRGRFNAAWLLPLLLLPLAGILLRNREEEAEGMGRIGSTPSLQTTIVEAMLRDQDTAIAVRSGAGSGHAITRTLPAGSRVRLSGRYDNDWAELAESGWIQIQSLTADPRVSAVRSH